MVLHLEAGNCESGIDYHDVDRMVNTSGVQCAEYHNFDLSDFRYHCPGCNAKFLYLSAFCQHMATDACKQPAEATFIDFKQALRDSNIFEVQRSPCFYHDSDWFDRSEQRNFAGTGIE